MQRPPTFERDATRRWMLCLGLALGLHALATLLRWDQGEFSGLTLAVDHDAGLSVELTDEPRGNGEPGGGSPKPDPAGAMAQPPPRVAPRSAPKSRAAASEAPQQRDEPVDTPPSDAVLQPSDLLAAAEGTDDAAAARPSPGRLRTLRSLEPEAAAGTTSSTQPARQSAAFGDGAGAQGGPGGPGAGTGRKVAGRTAFGGPTGAFHATVCFLDTEIASLTEIKHCPPQFSFYTDVLDVAPRDFTEGFPGISHRHEWFAIRYRGKFTVREAETFTFRLLSDDGSWLDIDGYRIIDNDRRHPPRSVQSTITLDAGDHQFSVFYYQGHPSMLALQLFVKPVNGPERLFGPVL